jgi:alpha-galactosidase
VRAKAASYFAHDPGDSDLFDEYRATGKMDSFEAFHKGEVEGPGRFEWADRKLVKFMLENYGLLPITTDFHFGEYLGWAHDVVDHRGILDFYDLYKI